MSSEGIEDQQLSRRRLLQVAGTFTVLPFVDRLEAQEQLSYEGPLKDFKFTDQYGEKFDPVAALAGKPHLLVFGYEGCPFCEGKITKTVAAVQKKANLPVVVVTIHPENDHDPETLREYAGKYSQLGVRQLPGTGPEDAAKAYETAKNKKPSERALHLLVTRDGDGNPSDETAIKLHLNTGNPYDAKNKDSHTPMLMLCDAKGKIIAKKFAALDANDNAGRNKIADDLCQALQMALGNKK